MIIYNSNMALYWESSKVTVGMKPARRPKNNAKCGKYRISTEVHASVNFFLTTPYSLSVQK